MSLHGCLHYMFFADVPGLASPQALSYDYVAGTGHSTRMSAFTSSSGYVKEVALHA
jgi:hypothetical protein